MESTLEIDGTAVVGDVVFKKRGIHISPVHQRNGWGQCWGSEGDRVVHQSLQWINQTKISFGFLCDLS
jgi:hypothetical protein